MRALSALIVTNEPDLVLFVGEALVGNDAVDQLSKFKVGFQGRGLWSRGWGCSNVSTRRWPAVMRRTSRRVSKAGCSRELQCSA